VNFLFEIMIFMVFLYLRNFLGKLLKLRTFFKLKLFVELVVYVSSLTSIEIVSIIVRLEFNTLLLYLIVDTLKSLA
jgi:hypothetical protein